VESPSAKPRVTVLVIDDEPLNRKLIRALLSTDGIGVIEAGDAETGLALARSEAPDLILLDLRLPGMSGTDALAALKSQESTEHIPVLILSAGSVAADSRSFRASGAAGLVLKPFTRDELLKAVRAIVG
jgi:CheY-like chemotaxis protein